MIRLPEEYSSPQDIVEAFQLPVPSTEIGSIKEALWDILGEVHPDQTNGEFKTDEQKNTFYSCLRALRFLQELGDREDHLPALQPDLTLVNPTRIDDLFSKMCKIDLISKQAAELRHRVKSRFRLPKASLFVTCCVLFYSLAADIRENTVYTEVKRSVIQRLISFESDTSVVAASKELYSGLTLYADSLLLQMQDTVEFEFRDEVVRGSINAWSKTGSSSEEQMRGTSRLSTVAKDAMREYTQQAITKIAGFMNKNVEQASLLMISLVDSLGIVMSTSYDPGRMHLLQRQSGGMSSLLNGINAKRQHMADTLDSLIVWLLAVLLFFSVALLLYVYLREILEEREIETLFGGRT
jgi:hypothetical protein